jgi:hypothetical protein
MDLAFATADLFYRIAAETDITEITAAVGVINDRLHHARIAEQLVIAETGEELSAMSALYASADREKLHDAIRCYHDARLAVLQSICKEQLSIAFAKR